MLNRRFETSRLRYTRDLSGWWDFIIDPEDQGELKEYYSDFPQEAEPCWVPSSWNTDFRYGEYFGSAWYRRIFIASWSGPHLFRFDGINYNCSVWLNGELLGRHEGGFLPFDMESYLSEGRECELIIKVDNRHSQESLPKYDVDWFHYGGIQRPPRVERIGKTILDRLLIQPFTDGRFRAKLLIHNRSDRTIDDKIRLSVEGTDEYIANAKIKPGESSWVTVDGRVPDVRLWSIQHPHLYTVRAEFAGDDIIERIGFREFNVKGNRITLNGDIVFLKGANRHDSHPNFGFAVPPTIVQYDLRIIKELGGNVLRSHYPPQEYVLDLCDEMGILYFDEIPTWQYSIRQLVKEPTHGKIRKNLQEMILRDFNHACVFAWSLGNESPTDRESDDEGIKLRPALKSLVKLVKSLDDSRFVTYTSSRRENDLFFDLYDMVTVNVGLSWYDNKKDTAEELKQKLDLIRTNAGDKPVFIGETAAAGSIPGIRNLIPMKWSEDYQYQAAESTTAVFEEREDISGLCIWQLMDNRAHPDRFLSRPRGYNNKGILDEYRRPKLMWHAVKQMFERLK